MQDRISLVISLLGSLLVVAALGCTSKDKNAEDETSVDFRNISRAYDVVIDSKKRPPRDVDEIRQVLAELHAANLNPAPEDVLISSRDKQPYEIIFGVKLGDTVSDEIFIYEKTGAEGIRYVMTTSRDIRQIPAAEFAQATFANGHRPSVK